MKKNLLLLYLIFNFTLLQASVLKIKETMKRQDFDYLMIKPLLEKLNFKTQKEEKLKFLAEFIRKAKATGTGTSKIYTLPAAYEAYARIKVSSNKNWNNLKYLFNAYIKNGEDKNDENAIQPKMIFRWGLLKRLETLLNNSNYKRFIEYYDRLSISGKKSLLYRLNWKVTDQGIIPFYAKKLEKGSKMEREKAALGLAEINNPSINKILHKYIEDNHNDFELNSVILQLLVRRGMRSELIYQLIEQYS